MPRTLPTGVSTVVNQEAYEAVLAVEIQIEEVTALDSSTLVAPTQFTTVDSEFLLTPTTTGLDCDGGKATPAWDDPAVWGPEQARTAGLTLFSNPTPVANTTAMLLGWADAVGSSPRGLYLAPDGYYYAELRDGVGFGCKIPYVGGTGLQVSIVLRAAGYFLIVDGRRRWVSNEGTGPVRMCVSNFDAAWSLTRTWAAVSRSIASDANSYSSHAATPAAGETGAANADCLVEWTWTPGAAEVLDVAFRRQDEGNCWLVRSDQAAGTIKLIERSTGTPVDITGATQTNPCVVTAAGHGLSNGDVVYLADLEGMTELNGNLYTVANKTDDTFELSGINASEYGEYTTGGTAALVTDTERNSDTIALTAGEPQRTVAIADGDDLRIVACDHNGTATTLTHTSSVHQTAQGWKLLDTSATGVADLYAWPGEGSAPDNIAWERICQGDAGLTIETGDYAPGPLQVSSVVLDGLPTVNVRAANTNSLLSIADERAGLVGKTLRIFEVHFDASGAALDPVILFSGVTTGVRYHLASAELQGKLRSALAAGQVGRILGRGCNFGFRDARCGYTGADTTCLKTLAACSAKSNQTRYGGLPTMPVKGKKISYQIIHYPAPSDYVGATAEAVGTISPIGNGGLPDLSGPPTKLSVTPVPISTPIVSVGGDPPRVRRRLGS